jgi:glucose-6-phosphate 1-dehydrogenase
MNPLREGLVSERVPEPHVMVIFGASGDLTKRKLLPALYSLTRERLLPANFAVVGVARTHLQVDTFREEMKEGCNRFSRRRPVDENVWEDFGRSIFYHPAQFDDLEAYRTLKEELEEIDREFGIPANRLFYLSTPPSVFPIIVENLGKAGLVSRDRSPWSRIIVEKPFGRDLDSARTLNRQLKQVFRETQIFRIDHYLGKETVQNMLAFRFANGLFEPIWNQSHIHHVQITSAESLGIEGRGGYFEEAGMLRDMVQNHLFQLLCLMGMEPPVTLDANAIRDEKVKFLRSLRPIPADAFDRYVVRAQYVAGHVLGESVPGYRAEEGVDPASTTETYVALRLLVDNWRWGNVPILLRAAKRMPKKVTDISIKFRNAPYALFGRDSGGAEVANVLTIRIQPDEGISLHFGSKVPGPTMDIAPVNMEFRYGTSFGKEPPEAYERLILDAMLGDATLFIRDDETEASWAFISRIHAHWAAQQAREIPVYPAGSWGPPEADALPATRQSAWRKP